MPVSIARLRSWFAAGTVLLVVVVGLFYLVRRYEGRVLRHYAAQKLGVDIEQTTEGFSYSHSEGGRTIYKISAKKATKFKDTGRAALQDVNIVVYGRDASRFDQIYGANFEYDTKTGNVTARGEVDIDLEANAQGPNRPDQATPAELKNPIHLKTSGLVFNRNTGKAHTDEQIELHVPTATGTAMGVDYDSHTNRLTLISDIHVKTVGTVERTLVAKRGVITKEPRRAVLDSVTVTQPDSTVTSDQVIVDFRTDNTIEHLLATGHVQAANNGVSSYEVQSSKANLQFGDANDLKSVLLSESAQFRSSGERPMEGFADRILVHFGPNTQAQTVRLEGNAHVIQNPSGAGAAREQQRTEVIADLLDVKVRDGKTPEKASTTGHAQVNVDQPASGNQGPTSTVITATRLFADFNAQGHIDHILGEPQAKVVSSAAGQAEKTSTSDKLEVFYNPNGELSKVEQQGHFAYHETLPKQGERIANANLATYTPTDDMLHLTGLPRVTEGGLSLTSNVVHINRRTGEAVAEGDVKSTYSDLKPQPNGAMLASGDPIHVTAKKMTAQENSGTALYTGGSRLWQGANIVQAPTIEFDRDHRSLTAQGAPDAKSPVTSVFVQKDKDGKVTPVNITARKLTYVDADRRARYEGGVTARSTDGVLTADHVDIFLKEMGQPGTAHVTPDTPSQLDRIVATGKVVMTQPGRRGSGNQLTYYQDDGRFVLTGGNPVITDAEHGTVRGDTLTFFSKDDRVLVEGSKAAPTVTHTRVSR